MNARPLVIAASFAVIALMSAAPGALAQESIPTAFSLTNADGTVNGYAPAAGPAPKVLVAGAPTDGAVSQATFNNQQPGAAQAILGSWVWNATFPAINVGGAATGTLFFSTGVPNVPVPPPTTATITITVDVFAVMPTGSEHPLGAATFTHTFGAGSASFPPQVPWSAELDNATLGAGHSVGLRITAGTNGPMIAPINLRYGADGAASGMGVWPATSAGPDTDGDGILDADDDDDDNDGVLDVDEVAQGSNPLDATSTPDTDDDGDGVSNAREARAGTNPTDPSSFPAEDEFPWLLVLAIVGGLLVLALLVFLLPMLMKSATLVASHDGFQAVASGVAATFTLTLTNKSKKDQSFVLGAQAPETWAARVEPDTVTVAGKGTADASLTVDGPAADFEEAATVTAWARPVNAAGKTSPMKPPVKVKAKVIVNIGVAPPEGEAKKKGLRLPFGKKKEPAPSAAMAGDVHPVEDVEGIGPTYGEKLRAAGVVTTHDLLARDASDLAEASGAPEDTVNKWKAMASLMRVKGIGKQYAEVLARVGVTGVDDLVQREPKALAETAMADQANLDATIQKNPITEKRVSGWVKEAKKLQKKDGAAAAQPAPAAAPTPPMPGPAEPAPSGGGGGAAAAATEQGPQISMSKMTHEPTNFAAGDTVKSKMTITNAGGDAVKNLKLSLFVNDVLTDTKVVDVKGGKTRDVTFKWTAQPDKNRVYVRGDLA